MGYAPTKGSELPPSRWMQSTIVLRFKLAAMDDAADDEYVSDAPVDDKSIHGKLRELRTGTSDARASPYATTLPTLRARRNSEAPSDEAVERARGSLRELDPRESVALEDVPTVGGSRKAQRLSQEVCFERGSTPLASTLKTGRERKWRREGDSNPR